MTLTALGNDYWSIVGHGASAIALYAIVGGALMIAGWLCLAFAALRS